MQSRFVLTLQNVSAPRLQGSPHGKADRLQATARVRKLGSDWSCYGPDQRAEAHSHCLTTTALRCRFHRMSSLPDFVKPLDPNDTQPLYQQLQRAVRDAIEIGRAHV